MKSKNKISFYILLTLAVCFAGYLIAQIIIPEPLSYRITDLANPPHSMAEELVLAYLDGQTEEVREHLSRTRLNRIYQNAVLSDANSTPESALLRHTETIRQHCLKKITNKAFHLDFLRAENNDTLEYLVCTGELDAPGPSDAVLKLTLQKEGNFNWKCDRIERIQ